MLFSSSASIQMLFQTQVVYMVGALWLKVRNGQQQSGFMLIPSTRSRETIQIVVMKIQVVRDGLNSASARITQSIWWDLLSFLATAGKVARHAHKLGPFFIMSIPLPFRFCTKNRNVSFSRAFSLKCFVRVSICIDYSIM